MSTIILIINAAIAHQKCYQKKYFWREVQKV